MRIPPSEDARGEKINIRLLGSTVWHTFLDSGILAAEDTGREERAMDGSSGEERHLDAEKV
jgi:hypothetical protein